MVTAAIAIRNCHFRATRPVVDEAVDKGGTSCG